MHPKTVAPLIPAAWPDRVADLFIHLGNAPLVKASALFGGAPRDADLGALWGEARPAKDYDIRVWLSHTAMKDPHWQYELGVQLSRAFPGSTLNMEPAAGTGRLRHVLRWEGLELDISARETPRFGMSSIDVAKERALDSDASLSSIAIASDGTCWCEAQYAIDRQARALTFYPGSDPARLAAYESRMRRKFPGLPVSGGLLELPLNPLIDETRKSFGG
jgi:hypothetical protein